MNKKERRDIIIENALSCSIDYLFFVFSKSSPERSKLFKLLKSIHKIGIINGKLKYCEDAIRETNKELKKQQDEILKIKEIIEE